VPQLVVLGGKATCSFGTSPATIATIPRGSPVMATNKLAGTIMDHAPVANLPTFGMCTTQSNPAVAAATAAASGTPTPAPCIPATSSPWSPGASKVQVGGNPALSSADTCNCMWGGVITVTDPGQTKVTVT
jgi:hypothetical protein